MSVQERQLNNGKIILLFQQVEFLFLKMLLMEFKWKKFFNTETEI
jgi:hypothetical protein